MGRRLQALCRRMHMGILSALQQRNMTISRLQQLRGEAAVGRRMQAADPEAALRPLRPSKHKHRSSLVIREPTLASQVCAFALLLVV